MQVFLLLADAAGQVVTRDRLYDECWGGTQVADYSLNRTITMVRRIAAKAGPGAFNIESIPRTGYRLLVNGEDPGPTVKRGSRWRIRALFIGLVLVAVGIASAWLLRGQESHEPTVSFVADDQRSAGLAAGIANAALNTAAIYQVSMRLTGARLAKSSADFILRVRTASIGSERKVDLTLVSEPGNSLVWSWSDSGSPMSIEKDARSIGASVVSCAAETVDAAGRRPDEGTVKLYLDACSKFEPLAGAYLKMLPDAFQEVTVKAPQLRSAWSKLFLSKAEAIEGFPPVQLADSLKKDIQNSISQGVEVPERYIAQAAVLPPNARFERLRLYEVGLEQYPRNGFLLAARSWQLRSVGRMDEAAQTAHRLATLYPNWSVASAEYAFSLMHSGRVEAARSVLDHAAKSSPATAELKSARWTLEMRYGDPQRALLMARTDGFLIDHPTINFLEARASPTRANVDRAVGELNATYQADPREPGLLVQALAAFGRTEEAIVVLLHYPLGATSGDGAEMLFRPHMKDVRRDPRFISIAQNFGLTDYWRASGTLPDFCFDPALPYDCKRELAKLRG